MAFCPRTYFLQVQAAVLAHDAMLRDLAYYGSHFRGRDGRVHPAEVWTLDKGHTWIHAPTGEQVTRFGQEGMGDPVDLNATSEHNPERT
jgi:hypothetical protein